MTDYPNRSGEDQTQGASGSQHASNPQNQSRASGLGDIKDKATQDFAEIREAAEAQARTALDKSSEMAAEKKNLIADQLAGVAAALQKVGGEMKDGETAMVGRYASDLGGSAKRLAEDLKNRDMSEIVSMAEDFGRRQPVAFLGLAAIAGLAASRFVTASGSRHRATSRMGEGAGTSANPMAGRQTVREVTPSARPTPQAGHSTTGQATTGQSSTGNMQPKGSQAASSSGMGLRTPGVSGAGQSGMGQSGAGQSGAGQSGAGQAGQSGTTSSQSGFGQGSASQGSSAQGAGGQSSSRPASGMEATGIGGSGLGTSRDRPSSSADTPTLNPSGPNPHPQQPGRVQIGETAIGQSSASPAQPNGQSSTRPSNLSNEGRSNV